MSIEAIRQVLANAFGPAGATDRSSTIAVAATSQVVANQNPDRKRLIIQNPANQVESLFINFGAAATISTATAANSLEILPGGVFDTAGGPVPIDQVTIIATTATHPFTAKEF